MIIPIIGGPHCGAKDIQVPDNLVEGQVVRLRNSDYFYHKPEGFMGRLLFHDKLKGY